MLAEGNQFVDQALLTRIWAGEEVAKEELVRKYQPMVHRIVRRQATHWPDYEDLCQEGTIGLLKAIGEYDPEHFAVKFSTFAYICILRRVVNVIKQAYTRKGRLLAEAVSLYAVIPGDEARTIQDVLVAKAVDPPDLLVESWAAERLQVVLRARLSEVEYAVVSLVLRGFTAGEIQVGLGLAAKVVDNARTRARLKLGRLIEQYGSLLNPDLPVSAKKRLDLAMAVGVGRALQDRSARRRMLSGSWPKRPDRGGELDCKPLQMSGSRR